MVRGGWTKRFGMRRWAEWVSEEFGFWLKGIFMDGFYRSTTEMHDGEFA
jgi:hypothetical protein